MIPNFNKPVYCLVSFTFFDVHDFTSIYQNVDNTVHKNSFKGS